MTRLAATLVCDVRLQFRNGFYYAAAFVALYSIFLLSWLEQTTRAGVMPVLVFANLMMNTFYFLGGLVLLEKREGTLEAQVVTPLRSSEYLLSKLATLTALSLLENLAIVLLAHGPGFGALAFVSGATLTAVLYALCGFAVVARYDSINEYLMPSFLYVVLLSIPVVPYFGLGGGWWVYLHPMQGPLLLLKAAFVPFERWQLVYGTAYPLLWVVPVFVWSRRNFLRFVVAREGRR